MKSFVKGLFIACLLTTSFASLSQSFQSIPEFVFKNPMLVSGSPNQDGAVYKFSNIAPGYDAIVTIISRSSSNVVLDTIDLTTLGWDKALQPQVGWKGNVPANTNWWMRFQLDFLQAGKNKPANIGKFQASALDVDGDAVSIQEKITMYKAGSVKFSTPTLISQSPAASVVCPKDKKPGLSAVCTTCSGVGYTTGGKQKLCPVCQGAGYVFSTCGDPWIGSDISITGPVSNAIDIDTNSVANMAIFTYNNVSSFTFDYGGQSGSIVTNGGERLNSMWFKAFSLVAPVTLPVNFQSFTATKINNNIVLQWSTASEMNFSHFIVERSTDGKNFTDIALVFGDGDINKKANYSYKDGQINCPAGILFYRLRAIDKSQSFTYSDVKLIRYNTASKEIKIIAFPNPVTDHLNITLPDSWKGKPVKLELYTCNGMHLNTYLLDNAMQTETIKIGTYSRGLYLLKASCSNESAESRIIKN